MYEKILYANGYLYEIEYDESQLVDVVYKTHIYSDNCKRQIPRPPLIEAPLTGGACCNILPEGSSTMA